MKQVLLLITAFILFFNGKKDSDAAFLKRIERSVIPVNSKLFAGKFEITNSEYRIFLDDLRSKNLIEKYNQCRIDSQGWSAAFPNAYIMPLQEKYHSHPAYDYYPLVNIGYESAVEFCNWLTQKYNTFPLRKHKKVVFRLPTEDEWKQAARGNLKGTYLPWGGPDTRNARGEFMANFKRIMDGQIKKDAAGNETIAPSDSGSMSSARYVSDNYFFTAPVKSFAPNNFGFYNISGNVSEMLAVKGKVKGGSWNSPGYYLRIDAENEFPNLDKPSPLVGFRYFMEITEE